MISKKFHIRDNSRLRMEFQYWDEAPDHEISKTLNSPEIDSWNGQNLLNQRKNQPIRCFYKKIKVLSGWIFRRIGRVLHNFIEL